MSLSKFIVLFVLSFSCFAFIANTKVQKFSEAVEKKVELNDAIDRALDAAVDDSILTTDDYTVEVSRKKCSDNFTELFTQHLVFLMVVRNSRIF